VGGLGRYGDPGCLDLSIPLHPCQGGLPPSNLSFGNRIDYEEAMTQKCGRKQLFSPALRYRFKLELRLRSFVKRACCPDLRSAVLLLTRQLTIATHRESADGRMPLLFGKA
jgi:hypothetical protein